MKVFWSDVQVVAQGNDFGITLDDRAVRTPAKAALAVPTRAVAEAIADEWRAQQEDVRPETMPVTRTANTAIDRVTGQFDAVASEIASYGETDLLCYRAPHPQALVDRQTVAWDPLLDWSEDALSAPLRTTTGLMHCLQPQDSLDALSRSVARHSPWELTALHDLVTLSGSLVIGLAVSHGHIEAEDAWPLSRIDEDWNIEEWGEDTEAAALASRKRTDFLHANRFMTLLAT
ncbi:MAG: ATP12 family protein [Pseudomonadota bacterium]